MKKPTPWTPLEVAVALSLYGYNVDAGTRAKALHDHFTQRDLPCAELDDLFRTMLNAPAYLATELAAPSAKVYVDQALARYGEEARQRCEANLAGWEESARG